MLMTPEKRNATALVKVFLIYKLTFSMFLARAQILNSLHIMPPINISYMYRMPEALFIATTRTNFVKVFNF